MPAATSWCAFSRCSRRTPPVRSNRWKRSRSNAWPITTRTVGVIPCIATARTSRFLERRGMAGKALGVRRVPKGALLRDVRTRRGAAVMPNRVGTAPEVVDDYVAGSCAPLPPQLSMALSSGMQDPQFVPARKVVPISAMLVARRLAIASCSAFRPTPKQAQMVRPGERAARGPSGVAGEEARAHLGLDVCPQERRPRIPRWQPGFSARKKYARVQAASDHARKTEGATAGIGIEHQLCSRRSIEERRNP